MQSAASRPIAVFAGLALLASPVFSSTAPPSFDPPTGDPFPVYAIDMEALGASGYYQWFEDIGGVAEGDTLFEIRVNVASGFQALPTFQVFGNCDGGSDPTGALFSLQINGSDTDWTSVVVADPCDYHDYLDQVLPLGEVSMKVIFDGIRPGAEGSGPDRTLVDARFGNILPAVPLPPAVFGFGAALAGLGALRRRAKQPT